MGAQKIRRVAVIGAGPAGAIATDALIKEQSFDEIRVFERKSKAGGTWVFDPNQTPGIPSLQDLIHKTADGSAIIPEQLPCRTSSSTKTSSHQLRYSDSGVYDDLHSNLPPSTMSFTQEPLPETLSQRTLSRYGQGAPFRHREVIRRWVEDIFVRNGSHKQIVYNTTVEQARKDNQNWVLTLRKGDETSKQDDWWQEEFDAVVVASGHYSIPYIPDIPGLVEWDQRYPGSVQHSKHYRFAQDYAGKKVIVVGGSVSAFDALHDIRTVARRPVIASLHQPLAAFGWAPFSHPHIAVKSSIKRVDSDTREVTFHDESKAAGVDVILFATGYDFSFPFLQDLQIENRRILGLYQHVFKTTDSSIAFIGMVSGGLTFRVFEWQAVATARLFAGRTTLPSQVEMQQWERDRKLNVGDGSPFFNIASDYEGYFEGLRKLAGEPAAGTTGRILPIFETQWADEFRNVVRARVGWWQREKSEAERILQQDKEPIISTEPVVRTVTIS